MCQNICIGLIDFILLGTTLTVTNVIFFLFSKFT